MVSRKSSSSIFSEQKAAAYRPPGETEGSQGQRARGLLRLEHTVGEAGTYSWGGQIVMSLI